MTMRNMYKLSMLEMNSILRPDNRIGGVMVSVLASSAVDRGFESRSGQAKDYAVASPISTQYKGERSKTGWLGIGIMCRNGATYLSADLFQ